MPILRGEAKLLEQREPLRSISDRMFDKVCGTDRIREMFLAGAPIEKIITFWHEGVADFRDPRAEYLLYDKRR